MMVYMDGLREFQTIYVIRKRQKQKLERNRDGYSMVLGGFLIS